ncbi:nucleotidyltransferase domain-containing protein [Desulfonema ishimotonii]|uniref:Nucleotidyltransferase domain-containing protein n=1 Tax=Desulfonema ishimotonii TaxID=45657 RepID=A0A401FY04_9BACT|nr:nucleotidyltransferase domain-containing protein [Desulfonema ishimotonii]GBC61813.1 nucleotidyltransferase domain-containing protein [Desulfonema ishimotonii]
MKKIITTQLREIEQQENVRILYACESGSRAWGFASEDSDYDVRFIYLHPIEWYLSIEKRRDVIERPIDDELDICGWDLKKALWLFRKSNPPLLEWFNSPIVYLRQSSVTEQIKSLMPEYYSPVSCLYHYLHMAQGNYREYLKAGTVRVKKYFYMLRPILACRWIENGYGAVPMEFETLLDRFLPDGEIRKHIDDLLERKKSGREVDDGPRIPALNLFIEKELRKLEMKCRDKKTAGPDMMKLDRLFQEAIREVWHLSF